MRFGGTGRIAGAVALVTTASLRLGSRSVTRRTALPAGYGLIWGASSKTDECCVGWLAGGHQFSSITILICSTASTVAKSN